MSDVSFYIGKQCNANSCVLKDIGVFILNLKLVSAIFTKFLSSHQMIVLQKVRKMLFS